MNRDQKAAVVEEIAGQIEAAQAIFAVDYRGISVSEAAELRARLREADTRYRVQLVGWQDTPSDWLPDPVQRYSHLAAGSYRFRVWGRDAAGVVSGPVEVAFVIPLSPWRTGWAYLLYLVAGVLLIGGGVRWRIVALQLPLDLINRPPDLAGRSQLGATDRTAESRASTE